VITEIVSTVLMGGKSKIKIQDVSLMITERCNLHCSYCFQKFFKSKFKNDTTEYVIKNFIDVIDKSGNSVRELCLWGGEPLLRPDLIKYAVDYSKKINVECFKIGTNGILLNENIDLVNGFDIYVSIDGVGSYNYRSTPAHVFKDKAWLRCDKSYVVCSPVCDMSKNNGNLVDQIKGLIDLGFHNFHIPMVTRNYGMPNIDHVRMFEREYDKLVSMHDRGEINIGAFLGYSGSASLKSPEVWGSDRVYCWVDIDGGMYPTYFDMLDKKNKYGDCNSGIDTNKLSDVATKFGSYGDNKRCGQCKSHDICLISGLFNYSNHEKEKPSYFSEGICAEYRAKARCYDRHMESKNGDSK